MHLPQTKVIGSKIEKNNPQGSRECRGRERIIEAAVRLANGSVFSGLFHVDAVEKARIAHAKDFESRFCQLFARAKDGFITSKGQFIRPTDAYKIAVKYGQITHRSYARSVEALWGIKNKTRTLNAVAFSLCRVA
ncbi:MAG: hypothetical protein ABSE90_03820 [Verrucomicrobiota bacterium]|jgi:hypothetical protein